MSSKKFGLGKGLNALIPEDTMKNSIISNEANKSNGVELININLIKSNDNQPRKSFEIGRN